MNLKITVAAVLALGFSSNAFASIQQFAASGLSNDFTWNGSKLITTNSSGGVYYDDVSLDLSKLGLATYNVRLEVNGGTSAGAATSGYTVTGPNNTGYFTLTNTTTISYVFATPIKIAGNAVSNLLTETFAAGTKFNVVDTGFGMFGNLGATGSNGLFTSDLLFFGHILQEAGSFTFSSIIPGGSGITNGFDAQGSGTFSSDPLPPIPEPLSAAVLIVGMTAVGVAARRRRTVA